MVNGKPFVTEDTVKAIFEKIFADCAHGHQPLLWNQWPVEWQRLQERLLKEYDKTAPWLGQPGNLPVDQQLWPQNVKEMEAMQLPQYYIGAFPTCFTIPEWNGQSTSMGQAPGTHWYHAHKHGSTTLNLANGMAGALIIEGDYDDKLKPFYKTERVLVLQQYGAVVPLLRSGAAPQNADLVSVNGQYTPVIQMNPNELQLWRVVNACHQAAVPINAAPAGLKWVQTAQDGVQLNPDNYNPDPTAPTNISFPVPAKAIQVDGAWVTTGSLAPGNRIDLLVQAPSTPGTFQVSYGSKNKLLLTVKVAQDPQSSPIPNPMPFPTRAQFPAMPGFLADIRPPVGMVRREIRFNTTNTQLPGSPPTPPPQGSVGGRNASGAQPPLFPNAPPMHTINGKQFSGEIDQYMKLGATEEWNLFNDSPSGGPAHPFHIHINPFQVIAMFDPSYMDASLKTTGVPLKEPWVWWDNFAIPPGGWAKMWTRFVDFTGTYVFHCHILGHEDRGMMQMVNVSPGGTVMTHK
jgi:FtsP/CotA-like multicopper oxidase with cupredoxin domain